MRAMHDRSKKHIPTRMCVACRTTHPKSSLIRIVRVSECSIVVDVCATRDGRGAYLCHQQICWRQAKNRKSLDQSLNVRMSSEIWKQLDAFSQTLPETLERLSEGG